MSEILGKLEQLESQAVELLKEEVNRLSLELLESFDEKLVQKRIPNTLKRIESLEKELAMLKKGK